MPEENVKPSERICPYCGVPVGASPPSWLKLQAGMPALCLRCGGISVLDEELQFQKICRADVGLLQKFPKMMGSIFRMQNVLARRN